MFTLAFTCKNCYDNTLKVWPANDHITVKYAVMRPHSSIQAATADLENTIRTLPGNVYLYRAVIIFKNTGLSNFEYQYLNGSQKGLLQIKPETVVYDYPNMVICERMRKSITDEITNGYEEIK